MHILLVAVGLLVGVTGTGVTVWWLHRKRREADILKEASESGFLPDFTAAHVAALRRLRFSWDPLVEEGGPMVDPYSPYGGSNLTADLSGLIGTDDALDVLRFHTEVAALLVWALKNAAIDEGGYPIDRNVRKAMAASLGRTIAHLPREHVARVLDQFPFLHADAPFTLAREHIALLRNLRFEWPGEAMIAMMQSRGFLPVSTVNFKRPFGDMSAYERDMERILGLEPAGDAKAREAWLGTLYCALWPALQAFLVNAELRLPATGSP